jgi:hypothetical protein
MLGNQVARLGNTPTINIPKKNKATKGQDAAKIFAVGTSWHDDQITSAATSFL